MADTPDATNAALEGADVTDDQAVREGALDDGESWSERAARDGVTLPTADPVDTEIARLEQAAAPDPVETVVAQCRALILGAPDRVRHVVMQRLRYEFGG